MARKKEKIEPEHILVVIVEGDADESIIDRLMKFYKNYGLKMRTRIENTHGFPNEAKIQQKLKKVETLSSVPIVFDTVVCEYDTDVFVKKIQLEPDWKKVEADLKHNYNLLHFCRIEAKTSIEDWMLDDLDGLLMALNLPLDTQLKGHNGQEKVKNLFQKKNIEYDKHKGKEKIKPILDKLDIAKIREARKKELKEFETLFGIEVK